MLGAPEIVGRLSVCSIAVAMDKLVPGSRVFLQTSDGQPIADWVANRTSEDFSFPANVTLKQGITVNAYQQLQGQSGLLSPDVPVFGLPTQQDLNNGNFVTPLFECAQCVWMYNLVPGASVVVSRNASERLGSAIVGPRGQVHIDLDKPLSVTDRAISAVQTACEKLGSQMVSSVPVDAGSPLPLDGYPMPSPMLSKVRACAKSLYFEKSMNGATAVISRTLPGQKKSNPIYACLPASPFTVIGLDPFQAGELVDVETRFMKCGIQVGNAVHLAVDGSAVGAPNIVGEICENSDAILLSGLEVGAIVEFSFSSQGTVKTLIFGAAAPQESFSLSLGQVGSPVLKGGDVVAVRQNLCGLPTTWSKPNSKSVIGSAPKTPSNASPPDYAMGVSLTPTLNWIDNGIPCSPAVGYEFRIGTGVSMGPSEVVFQTANIYSVNSISVPASVLRSATKYYWQVRARNAKGELSSWSNPYRFTTKKVEVEDKNDDSDSRTEFLFCQVCPGFDGGKTVPVIAVDFATAQAIAESNCPSTCFIKPGRCEE
jgi:hypothetical protein